MVILVNFEVCMDWYILGCSEITAAFGFWDGITITITKIPDMIGHINRICRKIDIRKGHIRILNIAQTIRICKYFNDRIIITVMGRLTNLLLA